MSGAGIIFLLIVGTIIMNQPLYLRLDTTTVKGSQVAEEAGYVYEELYKSCYIGSAIYLGTLILSVVMLKRTAPKVEIPLAYVEMDDKVQH